MKNLKKKTGLIAILAASLMSAAHAQSATVDATATLETPDLPLAVVGEVALSFGSVNVPNGTQADNKCAYNIAWSTSAPTYALRETNAAGNTIDSSAPTPSGCDWGSTSTATGQFGVFAVNCNPATPVDYTISYSSSGSNGVTLDQSFSGFKAGIRNGVTNGPLYTSSTTTITNVACPAEGITTVEVGGSISVDATASPATDVTVGTVTLEASY